MSCVGGIELVIVRHQSRYLQRQAPSWASYLHHNSLCFLYSYFMCYLGMKGSYSLHVGGQVMVASQVAKAHNKMWLGFVLFWIQSIKTVCTNREEIFPRRMECSVFCSYSEHRALHESDHWKTVKMQPFK